MFVYEVFVAVFYLALKMSVSNITHMASFHGGANLTGDKIKLTQRIIGLLQIDF